MARPKELSGGQRLDAQRVDDAPDAGLDLALRHLPKPHAEGDIGEDVEMREQRVVLEHHRDIAVARQAIRDILSVEADLPLGERLQPGDHPHGRGLAAARRADQHDEFPVRGHETEVLDRRDGAVMLPDAIELDRRHGSSFRMPCRG